MQQLIMTVQFYMKGIPGLSAPFEITSEPFEMTRQEDETHAIAGWRKENMQLSLDRSIEMYSGNLRFPEQATFRGVRSYVIVKFELSKNEPGFGVRREPC